jgi:hypothetical protein
VFHVERQKSVRKHGGERGTRTLDLGIMSPGAYKIPGVLRGLQAEKGV